MKLKTLTAYLALVALLATGGNALAASGDVGTPAPDFTLPVLNGDTYTLSNQIGQVAIMFVVGYA
ncbi:MAG: hypothetical protein GY780_00240 [bacterium]|nr:hypothetical protein [bacterium]